MHWLSSSQLILLFLLLTTVSTQPVAILQHTILPILLVSFHSLISIKEIQVIMCINLINIYLKTADWYLNPFQMAMPSEIQMFLRITKGINMCPMKTQCSKSPYGRVFHIKSQQNIKLFGPIPYKSNHWNELYEDRPCIERINTRIINDYRMKDCNLILTCF